MANSIKMYCLLVIGAVIVVSSHRNVAKGARRLPQKVVVQLHRVVKLLKNRMDQNRNVNREFKNNFTRLGAQVLIIMSLTRSLDYPCLWRLNLLANEVEMHYNMTNENEDPATGRRMAESMNEHVIDCLQMIEDRLYSSIGMFEILKKTVMKQQHSAAESTLEPDAVISAELTTLDRYIRTEMDESYVSINRQGNAAARGLAIGAHHPRNLYLNDIVVLPSDLLQLVSKSHLVNWDQGNFLQDLAVKFNRAVDESESGNNTGGPHSHLKSLRQFVYIDTMLVSVIGHLDVHFNAYRLHARDISDTGNHDVWNRVVMQMAGFLSFFHPVYDNTVVSDVYNNMLVAQGLDDPETLSEVCQNASDLLLSIFILWETSSYSVSERNTEDLLIDLVANVEDYPQKFMSVAVKNYEQLSDYINNLFSVFKDTTFNKFVHFLNSRV